MGRVELSDVGNRHPVCEDDGSRDIRAGHKYLSNVAFGRVACNRRNYRSNLTGAGVHGWRDALEPIQLLRQPSQHRIRRSTERQRNRGQQCASAECEANTFTATNTFNNATYSALFTGGAVGIGTTNRRRKKLEVNVSGDGYITLHIGCLSTAVFSVGIGRTSKQQCSLR